MTHRLSSFTLRSYHKSHVPTLYCAAVPIGNLSDVSERLISHLKSIQYIICENTLTTMKLMHALDISPRGKQLIQYAEDKKGQAFSERKIHSIVKLLKAQNDVLFVSEAGSACISDPGYQLVDKCIESGYRVSAIPGACAVTTALMMSGFNANKYVFEGFLDKRPRKRLEALRTLHALGRTAVLFENPTRLRQTLKDVEQIYGGETQVAICREMTKMHEEFIRGKLSMMPHLIPENIEIKGEVVVVIEGRNDAKEQV